LHDVGKSIGGECHHKASRDIIVKEANLPFRKRVRKIIGLIARYHKGAMPKDTHKYYKQLSEDDKRCVRMLAGMLKLADGLDAGHKELVTDLACEVRGGRVVIYVVGDEEIDFHKAVRKADLFEQAFGFEVEIRAAAAGKVRDKNIDSVRARTYADAA
jgi:exopolyphosphatase/guanosine-5'-triphosphate,3'-diphosphate pyrophosphatase